MKQASKESMSSRNVNGIYEYIGIDGMDVLEWNRRTDTRSAGMSSIPSPSASGSHSSIYYIQKDYLLWDWDHIR